MKKIIEYRKHKLERKLYRYSKVNSSITNACSLNNQGLFAESYLEFYHQKKLELDTSIKLIESQPFTLIYRKSDRPNVDYFYTPDTLSVSYIDERMVYEVKAEAFLTDELRFKYAFFEEALAEHGIGFRCITENDLGNWRMMNNILMLSGYLRTVHCDMTLNALAASLPSCGPFQYVNELAMKQGFQPTILRTLIAKGYYLFDLDEVISANTLVYMPSVVALKEAA